jgi:hypothetical protein
MAYEAASTRRLRRAAASAMRLNACSTHFSQTHVPQINSPCCRAQWSWMQSIYVCLAHVLS